MTIPPRANETVQFNRQATGIYIAFPTTPVLKPIYRKLKTQVNDQHTKVGITVSSFASREREYRNTFQGEVMFMPLAEIPVHRLPAIEAMLLVEMTTRFQRVGRAREWFATTERDTVMDVVRSVVRRAMDEASGAVDCAVQLSSKELGDAGEQHALELLSAHGYQVSKLPTNAPTYDLRASRNGKTFLVSVKVARDKQHVRLGTRNAVLRLESGNFVFAFMPREKQEITAMEPKQYRLLILPAEMVRDDSLRVHDAYWAARGGDSGYSVMVKGYGSHHRAMWPSWLACADAWHLLP